MLTWKFEQWAVLFSGMREPSGNVGTARSNGRPPRGPPPPDGGVGGSGSG
ncbi:hypothetical protein [Streptomyces sp. NBC_01637]|nr:hypothetical protein OH719_13100 [Streptomyces sp. NBC_01653]WTD36762.1 hypothetical protein OHB03_33610 [Streptomyces sp. NBC_01643]WTD92150.1 hypothetical protein OG891_33770 [Streptomyces sp. NBC_01637]